MTSDELVVTGPEIAGPAGAVTRVAASARERAVPVALDGHTAVVDVWAMPGGMHAVALRGDSDTTVLVLCYVDTKVRMLCVDAGIHEALSVDVWHVQVLRGIEDDAETREVMRHLADAAAMGAIPFSPIKPTDRGLWQTAADTFTALATRKRV